MALKDSSSYDPLPVDKPRARRSSDGGELVLLLLAVALAIAVVFLPNIRRDFLDVFTRPGSSTLNSDVMVWANRQSGNYYCVGNQYYGKGAGSYMRQGDALTEGYQPELGQYCRSGQSKDLQGVTDHTVHDRHENTPASSRPASVFPPTK